MQYQDSNLSIDEQIKLDNANAQKETIDKQNLLIQYLAEMLDIYIPEDNNNEGGNANVSNIEEDEK